MDEGIGRQLHSRAPSIARPGRSLASAETDAAAEDGDAAAEDDDAAAEGDDAAAEGDDAGSSACPDFDLATLVVPGDLGAGTVSDGTEDAADTGGLGTPATNVPAEPTRRRLMGDAPRMPLVETEAAAVVRVAHRRRALLEAAAEGADAAADGEGAAANGEGVIEATETEIDFSDEATLEVSAAVLGDAVSGGVCDGLFTTPAGQHAMVNQDIVFGQAREIEGVQYFRVVDMFTPSRSKPQPDHVFGGTDDITDAWGTPQSSTARYP